MGHNFVSETGIIPAFKSLEKAHCQNSREIATFRIYVKNGQFS